MEPTPAGPPPRPVYRSRPISEPVAPKDPRPLYVSAVFWLLSSLCALPTAWYAWHHRSESGNALYGKLSSSVTDAANLSTLRDLTNSTPKTLTIVALVLAVTQLLCVAQVIRTGTRAAKWSLMFTAIVSIVVLICWYVVTYGLPHAEFGLYQVAFMLQALFLLAGVATLFVRQS